jgi:hypothetical protein
VSAPTSLDAGLSGWWTVADQAELDLLVHEFTKAVWAHRLGCSICSAGGPWCAPLRDAFEGILEWREGRRLRSIAAALRARQTALDESAVRRRDWVGEEPPLEREELVA